MKYLKKSDNIVTLTEKKNKLEKELEEINEKLSELTKKKFNFIDGRFYRLINEHTEVYFRKDKHTTLGDNSIFIYEGVCSKSMPNRRTTIFTSKYPILNLTEWTCIEIPRDLYLIYLDQAVEEIEMLRANADKDQI